ncbi:hypothetical protein B4135_0008 [Caldibacillus debilis]|uniref:Uncharacterized protein n=1 Tax=Caldibacillus debilis TaxID=301148 RepID=A0A150M368_9BACI|nr:hypothetical protein B4135_0008 [Caldibacillus debilis]
MTLLISRAYFQPGKARKPSGPGHSPLKRNRKMPWDQPKPLNG